jgi:hemolysin activation/secretion protein
VSNRDGVGFESYGGFFSIPYGYWTLSLGGGRYEYSNVIEGNGQQFASDGVSWNASADLERLFFRDSDTKLSVSFGLRVNDTLNRIQGIRLSASSYRLVTGNVRFQVQQRVGPGLLQASAGLTRGFDILGANSADFGPGGPSLSFRKIAGDLRYFQPLEILGVKTRYSVQLRGQALIDPALPAQRFSLGGSGTIRGFRDDGISGRSGLFFRQQISSDVLEFPIGNPGSPLARIEAFTGYDAGGILPRGGDPFERGFIHSSIVGLSFNSPYFGASVLAAVPLSAPDFVQHKNIEFALSLRFGF